MATQLLDKEVIIEMQTERDRLEDDIKQLYQRMDVLALRISNLETERDRLEEVIIKMQKELISIDASVFRLCSEVI